MFVTFMRGVFYFKNVVDLNFNLFYYWGMTYTVRLKIEDYKFEIEASNEEQAEEIAYSRANSYVEEMTPFDVDVEVKNNG
tara:strand:+ start:850 stop:1089 length:240 start_codon:yes stop_codon:yes gene_type:complete